MKIKLFQIIIFVFVIVLLFGCDMDYKLRSEENPNYIEDAINEFNISEVYSKFHLRGDTVIDVLLNYNDKSISNGQPGDYQVIYGLVDDKDVFLFLPDYINSEDDVLFDSPFPSFNQTRNIIDDYNKNSSYQIELIDGYYKLIHWRDLPEIIDDNNKCSLQSEELSELINLYTMANLKNYLSIGKYYTDNCYLGEVAIVLYTDNTFGIIAANEEYYIELYRSEKE